jgi:hypothetical protein
MSFDLGSVPYPLVSPHNDDFESDGLECEIEQGNFDPNSASASFRYSFITSESAELAYLDSLCERGHAERVILIESPESLHRSSVVASKRGDFGRGPGELYGRVSITPYVVATRAMDDFDPPNRHAEWGTAKFSVKTGEVLALGHSAKFDISHKLLRKRSMINLVLSEEIDPEVYRIDASDDTIVVTAGVAVRRAIQIMDKDPAKKPALFMSLYKDVLQQGLLQAKENGGEQLWVRSLEQKLGIEHLDELGEQEIWDAPQRLVYEYGAKKIVSEVEDD